MAGALTARGELAQPVAIALASMQAAAVSTLDRIPRADSCMTGIVRLRPDMPLDRRVKWSVAYRSGRQDTGS
jgi:hypothetical protein